MCIICMKIYMYLHALTGTSTPDTIHNLVEIYSEEFTERMMNLWQPFWHLYTTTISITLYFDVSFSLIWCWPANVFGMCLNVCIQYLTEVDVEFLCSYCRMMRQTFDNNVKCTNHNRFSGYENLFFSLYY